LDICLSVVTIIIYNITTIVLITVNGRRCQESHEAAINSVRYSPQSNLNNHSNHRCNECAKHNFLTKKFVSLNAFSNNMNSVSYKVFCKACKSFTTFKVSRPKKDHIVQSNKCLCQNIDLKIVTRFNLHATLEGFVSTVHYPVYKVIL